MSDYPTTVRVPAFPTIERNVASNATRSSEQQVRHFWRNQQNPSVLQTLEEFPSLLENQSLLLDLVIEEFQGCQQEEAVSVDRFCEQFQHLGSSLEQSLFRAVEVQDYLNRHPELLELVTEFGWPKPGDSLEGFAVVDELGRGAMSTLR